MELIKYTSFLEHEMKTPYYLEHFSATSKKQ